MADGGSAARRPLARTAGARSTRTKASSPKRRIKPRAAGRREEAWPSALFRKAPPRLLTRANSIPGLPRDQFYGPWLFSTAEARTINSSSSLAPIQHTGGAATCSAWPRFGALRTATPPHIKAPPDHSPCALAATKTRRTKAFFHSLLGSNEGVRSLAPSYCARPPRPASSPEAPSRPGPSRRPCPPTAETRRERAANASRTRHERVANASRRRRACPFTPAAGAPCAAGARAVGAARTRCGRRPSRAPRRSNPRVVSRTCPGSVVSPSPRRAPGAATRREDGAAARERERDRARAREREGAISDEREQDARARCERGNSDRARTAARLCEWSMSISSGARAVLAHALSRRGPASRASRTNRTETNRATRRPASRDARGGAGSEPFAASRRRRRTSLSTASRAAPYASSHRSTSALPDSAAKRESQNEFVPQSHCFGSEASKAPTRRATARALRRRR